MGLPRSQSPVCPIKALKAWLSVLEQQGISQGALFRNVDRKNGKGGVIGSGLSGRSVARILKDYAQEIGLDPSAISGHSLRSGAATTLAMAGVDLWKVQQQGGWKDTRMLVERYIRTARVLVDGNMRLAKMNLAVHGLFGDIRQANSYYDDEHESVGKFDFVMANPPFNVDGVDKERIKDDPRFPFGMPRTDNANYLWIQLFNSALNDKGRAGFVMANSASDARASELDIRQALIKSKVVDVMIAVGSNFFYTVTLPCTLWFLDKGKSDNRKDTVLFIDARHLYQQVTRAIREFTLEQIEFIAHIVRLYRGEAVEAGAGSKTLLKTYFPDETYQDVPGLCKVATLAEIEAQGWSLNPGRYVGVAAKAVYEFDFKERLGELSEELEKLNVEARELEALIAANVATLLEG